MDSGRESSIVSYMYEASSNDTIPAPNEDSPIPRRRMGPNPKSGWELRRFEVNIKPLYYGFNTPGERIS